MNIRGKIAVLAGKTVKYGLLLLNRSAGATWPGEIALRIDPGIIKRLLKGKTVILVAGTNGKTTTAKMIETILKTAGKRVKRNTSGANLDNGIASILISDTFGGTPKSDVFVFEVDEATLPVLLRSVTPTALVLLNLFRDQLDRYGEVDTIAVKWQEALSRLPKTVKIVMNADDPHLVSLAKALAAETEYFALDDPSLYLPAMQHATDTIYCPQCGTKLTFGGVYFSHLGKWACGRCGLYHPEPAVIASDFDSPLEGVYNKYNTLAAALTAHILGLPDDTIREGLKRFTPAFGRQEELVFQGKAVKILLSKNPTGFNESIRTVLASEKKGPLLLLLNDRIPDGTDVSWIWDVDFEVLSGYPYPIIVSGDRVFDLGLRLKYAGLDEKPEAGNRNPDKNHILFETVQEPDTAVGKAIGCVEKNQTLWILPTYSAMLDVRKVLTGKKIG